jgi:serine/threonine protein kinase
LLFLCIIDEIIKKIGKGGFGNVYLCKRENEEKELAMKVVENSSSFDLERIIGEVMKLNSHFFVKYEEIFNYGEEKCIIIIMSYFKFGDLSVEFKSFKNKKELFPNKV